MTTQVMSSLVSGIETGDKSVMDLLDNTPIGGLVFKGRGEYRDRLWVWWVEDHNGERWEQGVSECGDEAYITSLDRADYWNAQFGGGDPVASYKLLMSGKVIVYRD